LRIVLRENKVDMPDYQIHRLKETQRQQFRWAPHTPGVTIVKLKDYEAGPVVEAATPYALWLALRETDNAIAVGDLIEVLGDAPGGELRILKYIGFEEARWYVPEPAPNAIGEPVAVT
jgi:hypothetical protein